MSDQSDDDFTPDTDTPMSVEQLAEGMRQIENLPQTLGKLERLKAERDNLRRLLALLWQRMNTPREGDVPEGAGLYIGFGPKLSAAEFREIGAALKEGKS